MPERRHASSAIDHPGSTLDDLMALASAPVRKHWHLSTRGQRRFNIGSWAFIALIAIGWIWSITTQEQALAGSPSAARIISRALSDSRSPSVAYLTDAALQFVNPLRGQSGKLRAALQQPGTDLPVETLPDGAAVTFSSGQLAESTSVATAPATTGIWSVALAVGNAIRPVADFSVITLKPASAKRGGRIGLYYIGNWPTARGKLVKVKYDAPRGFIEVTRDRQNTELSDHFRLKDFFPHDQANVWPKYIVVEMKLIDKMELILAELEKQGIPARGVKVMSGFRTPQYNRSGGDPRGRATLSRHMYGDAADIFIDNNGDGQMDDLNRDGKINAADARVLLAAANRVEAAHPSLIGGVGVYAGNSAHGPFTHIDTRGYPARWIGTGD